MKNNSPKHIAHTILLKNKLISLSDCNDLCRIIQDKQFTIIEYRKHNNSIPVDELIQKLGIGDEIKQNNSFLYIRDNLKFLFINSDIPKDDKCALLRHELGHICDPELTSADLNSSSVKKEEFANEFSCYAKNPGIFFRIYLFLFKKWKLLIAAAVLIACVLGFLFALTPPTTPSADNIPVSANSNITYYVTSSGEKYHRENCIIIKYKNNLTELTLDEAIASGYTPCLICNPGEEKID